MTFETFENAINVVRFWRSRTGKYDYQWPDSRDPDLIPLLEECKTVPQDLEKAMVAITAFRSAEDGVYQSISSIVHVIKNRQNKGMIRSHLSDVDQFPEMNSPWEKKIYKYPVKEQEFEKVLGNLDDILQGKTIDITQGSIYFGVVGSDMPKWFADIVHSPDMERTVKISNTTFYKPKEKK